MPTPAQLFTLPDGSKLGPFSVDAIPADWATVQYTIIIAEHPDLPGVAILKFVEGGGGSASGYAFLYLTGIEGSTGNTIIINDETGAPISAYAPV